MKLKFLAIALAATVLIGCGDTANDQTISSTSSEIADKSKEVADVAIDKSKEFAHVVADKSKEAAHVIVDKSKEIAGVIVDKSKEVTSGMHNTANDMHNTVSNMHNSTNDMYKTANSMHNSIDENRSVLSDRIDGSMGKTQTITYQCGHIDFPIKINSENNGLIVTIDDEPQELTLVESASGAKYSNGIYSFWSKGREAIITKGEEVLFEDCMLRE